MKTKGYRTGHFGKWHLGTLTTKIKDANRGGPKGAKHYSSPQQNGFDICFSTESKVPTWDPMLVPKKFSDGSSRRKWWDPLNESKNADHYGTHYWDQNGKVVTENLRGSNSRVIMDRAIPFMKNSLKSKSPFFTVIWFHTPHLPVIAGPKYTKMYQSHSKYQQHYFGCITAMDEQIGRLRKALKEANAHKNTMIWFCSDNGPEGNDSAPGKTGGFRGRKRSLYEGGIRVPALLEWPERVQTKSTIKCPAGTIDYLPTILSALNIKFPDSRPIDGIDLNPIITNKVKVRGKPMGFQSNSVASLITDRYKIIVKNKNKNFGSSNSISLLSDSNEALFYFYNSTAIAYGKTDFKNRWGNRRLVDNWRWSISASDEKNNNISDRLDQIDKDSILSPSYYINLIPKDINLIDSIRRKRNDAYFRLGAIYKDQFEEYEISNRKLYNLLESNPDSSLIPPSKFFIHKNWSSLDSIKLAKQFKEDIIKNHPDSKYAEILLDPQATINGNQNSSFVYEEI